MREALQRGIPVVTSNKWPVALRGVELAELARSRGVAFRAESTVSSPLEMKAPRFMKSSSEPPPPPPPTAAVL